MKKILLTFTLILVINLSHAGFPPFTDISPNNITVGQEVFMGYDLIQSPCLQSVPNSQGLTSYVEMIGNHIDIIITGLGTSPCLNIPVTPPPYYYYSLGMLPEGNYTAQMYWVSPSRTFPLPEDVTPTALGETLAFSVGAPITVPTLGQWGIFALLILFFGVGINKMIKETGKKLTLMLVLLSLNSIAFSKTFHIMLSTEPGAPSADVVVNQASTSPSPPAWVLESFNQESPESVDYLIKERPEGNRLNLVNNAPDWALSKLYRYLVVTYPDAVDENSILSNFQNDGYVERSAFIDTTLDVSSIPSPVKGKTKYIVKKPHSKLGGGNFLTDLNITSAWELSEGMGYIGALDLGIQVDHPDLRAFDDVGNYLGGNILDGFYQIDVGDNDLNIDEQEPFDTQGQASLEACDLQDGIDDNLATSIFVGHGTHITGIMTGANNSIGGICKNCGMSMMKNSTYRFNHQAFCVQYGGVFTLLPQVPFDASINGMTIQTNVGVGVVNWSGGAAAEDEFYCDNDSSGLCLALEYMQQQNTLMVGAAGNHRTLMQFPASEVGTVAVGGLDENGIFWNESPSNNDPFDFSSDANCPRSGGGECGSNISHSPINQKLDVMTQARTVYSTFYTNGEWADDINCTDFQDGAVDGYGNCTGTSMSAPQVAGIMQLMRSTHPLLPNGTVDPNERTGLINVLNATASRSTSGQGVHDFLGYGLPDARLALETILGESNGVQMKTRLTPMFVASSAEANNHVYSPFPQVIMAFLIYNGATYAPDTNAPLVNEFTEFWYDTANLTFPAPRASFYVFTTNNNPFVNLKNMVPLRRMEKSISATNRNDTYAVNDSEIETFKADGYNLAGIEGYIFPVCGFEPGCIPANAHKLYRVVDDVNFNHTLVNLPINDPAPANSTKLGYVFPNVDTDGDGLIDGQERILGTLIGTPDTDGDGMTDGFEYPPAGIPFSDPLISDIIFENGFE